MLKNVDWCGHACVPAPDVLCVSIRALVKACVLFLQVSALLGRIPSAVGYQPTLATDMGTMQERITTTQKGSITSVQVDAFAYLTSYLLYHC